MKLVWHIVLKDGRRLWLPLSLWLLLQLAHLALLSHAWHWGEVAAPQFEMLRYFSGTWGVIISAVGFLLAAWLVMEDSLVLTTAFWPTRPISGPRLLAAKTTGALLLLSVLPVLVLTPLWLLCGFSAFELGRAALDVAMGQGLLSLAAFALACVTATSGQFLVRAVGALIILPLSAAFALGKFSKCGDEIGAGLGESRYWLVLGILLVTPLILVVYQFLTRRTSRSCLILGLGLTLVLGVRYLWYWDFSQGQRELSSQNQTLGAAQDRTVTFHTEQTVISPDQNRDGLTQIRVQGEATGLLAGTYVRVNSARGGWIKADEWFPMTRDFKAMIGEAGAPSGLVRQIAGLGTAENVTSHWLIDADETGESVERFRAGAMKLRLNLSATLMRGHVIGELPLRAGAELRRGASTTRLVRIEHVDGKVFVCLAARDASHGRLFVDSYRLLNRSSVYDQFPVVNEIGSVSINSIQIGQLQLVITPPIRELNGHTEEIPGWEENAVIVKIRFQPEYDFTHLITVEPFAKAAR